MESAETNNEKRERGQEVEAGEITRILEAWDCGDGDAIDN
jgi:hypothetical protein